MKRMRLGRFFFVIVVVLVGCSRPARIVITNHSAFTISNVVISGSGFTNDIDSMAPAAESTLSVRPKGESGLRVEFDAAGKHVDSGEQGYFEAGYDVTAVINTNLSLTVKSQL